MNSLLVGSNINTRAGIAGFASAPPLACFRAGQTLPVKCYRIGFQNQRGLPRNVCTTRSPKDDAEVAEAGSLEEAPRLRCLTITLSSAGGLTPLQIKISHRLFILLCRRRGAGRVAAVFLRLDARPVRRGNRGPGAFVEQSAGSTGSHDLSYKRWDQTCRREGNQCDLAGAFPHLQQIAVVGVKEGRKGRKGLGHLPSYPHSFGC